MADAEYKFKLYGMGCVVADSESAFISDAIKIATGNARDETPDLGELPPYDDYANDPKWLAGASELRQEFAAAKLGWIADKLTDSELVRLQIFFLDRYAL